MSYDVFHFQWNIVLYANKRQQLFLKYIHKSYTHVYALPKKRKVFFDSYFIVKWKTKEKKEEN